MSQFYRDYADFLRERFDGKMQKITVDAGFSCPNRDGTIGRGGCVYCNNLSFSPMPSRGSIAAQIEAGKAFFARKYPRMRYLAYFQSYTNTHGPIDRLMELYSEALATEGVDGLIIGTRPDCVSDELLRALSALSRPVIMEYGAESSHNDTLRVINRCHTWEQTVDTVERTVAAGLPVGLHFIMGLPGETEEMMLQTAARAARLPISTLKFHQLQIISGTPLAREIQGLTHPYTSETSTRIQNRPTFRGRPIEIFSVEAYIDLCVRIVETIVRENPSIAIERFTSQAPAEMLIAPRWGLKNYQFAHLLEKALKERFNA
ncbi:MAG: TIGR01212 family radical SAM protein [bacterium]|nr:TIGR01212 family radical SAM protein [bacterium]